jgi:hypothetical protein
MDNYNFWADLLATFKSSPDWIKALWLLVPPGFVLAVMAMPMRFGLALRRREKGNEGELVVPVRYRSEGAPSTVNYNELSTIETHQLESFLQLLPSERKDPLER